MMTKHYNKQSMRDIRRELRQNQTNAEEMLWCHLRNRQLLNVKFRRQYSIDRYVVDFYAPEFKLVIELDGPIHQRIDQQDYDRERESHLELFGITILHFNNEELIEDTDKVLGTIKKTLVELGK